MSRLTQRGGNALQLPNEVEIARELDMLDSTGARMIAYTESEFSPGLAALDPPPPLIFALGDTHVLRRDAIAILGTRNALAPGLKVTKPIRSDPDAASLMIASGLARGIDPI